ncbi:ARM repeat-containing protein [Dichomitus squalens]|uniref:Nucleolar protein 9 n=1 Tax=Dichomitus squalens TaxID=114155 RepID=A0A4Q9Q268_9APHY|nr:ARM repeat-containing protein [Dichomitus squalens]TBU61312.1 ARM repeat-containing protein [Dichomitus squalens]
MPRENRKRGKKHKKSKEEAEPQQDSYVPDFEEQEDAAGPSWIVPARDAPAADLNAPFGYVDAEVKAYFRTVDVQIREWQETKPEVEADEDVDPNEDRRLFFVAALTEMSGKEKQLATDPDCSTILERMVYSMDDFVRRVFMDRLSGSFEQLSKHRFASHVCQTLLTVASETVARESKGILPPTPEEQEDEGELRTLTQLVLDACEELLPSLSSLIMDPFASHVIRALLLLLASDVLSIEDTANSGPGKSAFALRSKKSAAYKARQGSMKSVFENGEQGQGKRTPKEFRKAAFSIVSTLREQLGGNEVRALAANQVASPVLQMLLELEAAYEIADTPGSLMDHALVGMVTAIHENPDTEVPESDYLMTLLRDPTASHLLETLVRRSPDRVFDIMWRTYFAGKLAKLAVHPVANFVVAKAFERLSAEQLDAAVEEVKGVAGKIVKNSRTGVLRALVDRAGAIQSGIQDVVELVVAAFELESEDAKALLVPCILRLKPLPDYQKVVELASREEKEPSEEPRHKRRKTEDPLEPKVPGAVLLQSMLRLPSPHNDVVLHSLQAMSLDDLIQMAHHSTSSRVFDVALESETVPKTAKRKFVLTFIGHYHVLVDDRIGSRVGDRCWASADPYLKEKIARSLIPHEHALAGSFYGKFFARNLNLHVLQRDPERWKSMQATAKQPVPASGSASNPTAASRQPQPKSLGQKPEPGADVPAVTATAQKTDADADRGGGGKRKAKGSRPQDEIDALFDATLGKKVKKAELASVDKIKGKEDVESKSKSKTKDGEKKSKKRKDEEEGAAADKDLSDVLGAIRSAPKDDKGPKKRKRAH